MKFPHIDQNNIYVSMVDGIPGDVPGSFYSPEGVSVSALVEPPTDEPGKWRDNGVEWVEVTAEKKAELIRQQRNALLSATDYRMMPDYPMSELCRENLKLYRQLLRDIPEQPGFPNSVVWPIKGE